MRLIKFISEAQKGIVSQFDPDILKRECADYISKDPRFPDYPLFRSINSKHVYNMDKSEYVLPMIKLQSYLGRGGREPVDISYRKHEQFNALFNKKFGWPARDGVFVAKTMVGNMANCNVFMPCGEVKYVWSPKVYDLYETDMETDQDIKDLVNSYTDKNIQDVQYGNEISFNCKEYYCIRINERRNLTKFIMEMSK